jgi:hypothetical protein
MKATSEELRGWFAGRIPDGWFTEAPEVTADRDEILVVGSLSGPEVSGDASDAEKNAARAGRIDGFREDTRQQRMRIADDAEERFGRKVAWGAECGGVRKLFTTMSIPVMSRLRMPERQVLDTLVDAGVARSRSHALAWCVKLVGQNQEAWIKDLQGALVKVQEVRSQGPA